MSTNYLSDYILIVPPTYTRWYYKVIDIIQLPKSDQMSKLSQSYLVKLRTSLFPFIYCVSRKFNFLRIEITHTPFLLRLFVAHSWSRYTNSFWSNCYLLGALWLWPCAKTNFIELIPHVTWLLLFPWHCSIDSFANNNSCYNKPEIISVGKMFLKCDFAWLKY